jgi:hypothetical protein
MQKLARLRALIQDSPLSSNDAFVRPRSEPHPGEKSTYIIRKKQSLTVQEVVQSPSESPVKESTPQDIRISRSRTSPVQSVHSTSEEPLHLATILSPKLRRALSRSSSLLPSLMSSKGNRKAEKDDVSAREKEEMASVASGTGLANYMGPNLRTIWSEQDSYLPRAKPPPPLKRIKRARNRSENNVSPPDPTIPSRPATSHSSSSGQSSQSYSTTSCSSRRSLDVPSIEVSNEDSNQPAADVRCTLTRIASGASEDSGIIFVPSSPNWQPPTSWTGPSKAVLADEDHRQKPGGWFAKKKMVQTSSKGGSMQALTRLNRARSVREMVPAHMADTGEPEEQEASVIQRGPLSSDVMVKIHCYEDDEWHETPMVDIIPKLRELKFK